MKALLPMLKPGWVALTHAMNSPVESDLDSGRSSASVYHPPADRSPPDGSDSVSDNAAYPGPRSYRKTPPRRPR